MSPLVEARGLTVRFGPVEAVSRADLSIGPGEIVGIAGESGSGKTTLCAALIRALPRAARVEGQVRFDGRPLYDLSQSELRRLRGREIAMVLQNPMTSLDPLFTVGNQLGEVLSTRAGVPFGEVGARALGLLRAVHLTAPETRLRQYPHELSGGMRQRVLTAMASAPQPRLLIADEPTTALDATIQEEILLLFREFRASHGAAVVIVTHDLGVIRRICDRIVVMYAGRIVEEGPVERLFQAPRHPYTRALLGSIPRVVEGRVMLQPIPGQVPDLTTLGESCPFAPRCPDVVERCRAERPVETRPAPESRLFCWQAPP